MTNFGVVGWGAVGMSLTVKYFSPTTNLCIIRVARDNHRIAWGATTLLIDMDDVRVIPHVVHVWVGSPQPQPQPHPPPLTHAYNDIRRRHCQACPALGDRGQSRSGRAASRQSQHSSTVSRLVYQLSCSEYARDKGFAGLKSASLGYADFTISAVGRRYDYFPPLTMS